MRKTDAAEISADNPTVSPVTRCFAGKRTKDVQAAQIEPPDFYALIKARKSPPAESPTDGE